MTQAELAERLKVDDRHVRRIESGAANLTLWSLARVANALGVPMSVFFERRR